MIPRSAAMTNKNLMHVEHEIPASFCKDGKPAKLHLYIEGSDSENIVSLPQEVVEALEFYANESNWRCPAFGLGHVTAVAQDGGERARKALKVT